MRTHSKHVLMCTGPHCTEGGNEVGEHVIHRLGAGDV